MGVMDGVTDVDLREPQQLSAGHPSPMTHGLWAMGYGPWLMTKNPFGTEAAEMSSSGLEITERRERCCARTCGSSLKYRVRRDSLKALS